MPTAPSLSDLPPDVRSAMDPLPAGYVNLLLRVLAVVGTDARIRALWLGGSLGRQSADAGSDLDVLLAVADDDFDDFAAGWRQWLGSITSTIIARPLPGLPGSFFSVTSDCERLDVVAERVSAVGQTPYLPRVAVLDRDGLGERLPRAAEEPPGPDRSRLAAIVEEFFREQAIFPPAVVAREDWLLGVVAVSVTQRALYDLFVEANQPLPLMGIKRWTARLTPHQREVLTGLPSPAATREDTIRAMVAVRRAMLTEGRRAVEAAGVDWPQSIDDAVARFWSRELG